MSFLIHLKRKVSMETISDEFFEMVDRSEAVIQRAINGVIYDMPEWLNA